MQLPSPGDSQQYSGRQRERAKESGINPIRALPCPQQLHSSILFTPHTSCARSRLGGYAKPMISEVWENLGRTGQPSIHLFIIRCVINSNSSLGPFPHLCAHIIITVNPQCFESFSGECEIVEEGRQWFPSAIVYGSLVQSDVPVFGRREDIALIKV